MCPGVFTRGVKILPEIYRAFFSFKLKFVWSPFYCDTELHALPVTLDPEKTVLSIRSQQATSGGRLYHVLVHGVDIGLEEGLDHLPLDLEGGGDQAGLWGPGLRAERC